MECGGTMVEGGEWSCFNGVSVNEEAEFLAHMFPINYSNSVSNTTQVDGLYLTCWAPQINDNVSFYSSEDSNLNSNFSHGSDHTYDHDQNNYSQQLMAAPTLPSSSSSSSSSTLGFPVLSDRKAFLSVFLENSMGEHHHHSQNEFLSTNLQLKCAHDHIPQFETTPAPLDDINVSQDKSTNDDSSDTKKRSWMSQKGKRNVRSKKSCRTNPERDHNEISSCSEEDSNGSPEMVTPNTSLTSNSHGKTRASRGSATDPQSLYARKRRERINERLRTLQNLVPNGTKVDISTMLEEAVHYVKFLQLQIKLLSSDELWKYAPLAYNGIFPDHIDLDLMRKNM